MCVTHRQSIAVPTLIVPHTNAKARTMPGTHRDRGARPRSSWVMAKAGSPPAAASARRQRGTGRAGEGSWEEARATAVT